MAQQRRNYGSLQRRAEQQVATIDSKGGVGRRSFMDYSKSQAQVRFFKFADPGEYQDVNILPWEISSKDHPEVVAGNAKVGDMDYVLDLWIHQRIGPNKEDHICLKKTYGRECPTCDLADDLWKDESTKDEARNLFSKRKCVYIIQPLDSDFHAPKDDIYIFEMTHSRFAKGLQGKAVSSMRGRGVVNFADPYVGKVVSFTVVEEKMNNGRKYSLADQFEFNERQEEISEDILMKVPSLDTFLTVKTADQIRAILNGDPDDLGQDYDEPPTESNARFQDTPSVAEEAPTAAAPDTATKPARRRVKEDPVAEVIVEKPQRKAAATTNPCPSGHTFGADCDTQSSCARCPDDVYNKCLAHAKAR